MTTIPVDLGWLILAGFILITGTVYFASYGAQRDATRHHRKWMKAHEATAQKAEAAARQLYDDAAKKERHVIAEWKSLTEREVELGRKAHDLATQTHVLLRQANSRDTVPTMQEL